MKAFDEQVLRVLIDHRHKDDGWMYALEIADELRLGAWKWGGLYIAFDQLERQGLVEFRFNPADTKPRRAQRRAKPDRIHELIDTLEQSRRKRTRHAPKWRRLLRPWGVRS
jgi:DNA-binding PadR family transcriptional regulator